MRSVLENEVNLDCNSYGWDEKVLGRVICLNWITRFMVFDVQDIPRVSWAL